MRNCRRCAMPFVPTVNQVRRRDYQCARCARECAAERLAARSKDPTARRCSFPGCGRIHWANGYCSAHDNQIKEGRPLAPLQYRRPQGEHGTCGKCDQPATYHRGNRHLCVIHNRFDTMQACARSKWKRVPSDAELAAMVETLQANGMVCFGCGVVMEWAGKHGQANVVTLQHDRDGTLRLICMLCNNRHDDFPGDTFYQSPPDHYYCPKCERVLPRAMFYRTAKGGRRSYCKDCKKVINRESWPGYWLRRKERESQQ